ncbi:MAG: hypothetical protein HY775_04330 [Acidobacteria bacterium]|nr:hypothetical protein [Acidobacteriota bacterium]
MKIVTAKVAGGRVELPPDAAADGTTVTVLVPEEESSFLLTPGEVRELQASIDEASRGEVVDGWQLLTELRS